MYGFCSPFCSVCKEAIIEKIYDLVDPVEDLKPNQQPPITTCLKLYNYCLETDRLTLESQQEDDEHDLEQQPDLVEGMEIQR